jgi:hypothetical protein
MRAMPRLEGAGVARSNMMRAREVPTGWRIVAVERRHDLYRSCASEADDRAHLRATRRSGGRRGRIMYAASRAANKAMAPLTLRAIENPVTNAA